MGSLGVDTVVHDIRLSSVVPGTMTAQNTVHEFSNIDLVMKLHYLKGLYFFHESAVRGISIADFKDPMFEWLELYYHTCGRIRETDSGRPFVKCNDSGVRIFEARCSMTLDECLLEENLQVHNQLFPSQVLGPELAYCPLVLIQFTWFRCGGMSVGLSWAHVLGDAFSASQFINTWGQIMAGKPLPKSLKHIQAYPGTTKSEKATSCVTEPLSIKKMENVGDSWIVRNDSRMKTLSIQFTATQLKHLQSKVLNPSRTGQVPVFETLCAIIWHCLAKIRGDSESSIITTCRNGSRKQNHETIGNNQIISVVKADFNITKTEPSDLVALISKEQVDETGIIKEIAVKENSQCFTVYGASLTFVDLEDADLYGLEFKGQKPVFTNFEIDGVGKKGVALVLPGPERGDGRGKTVTLVLPEDEVMKLKTKLQEECS